MDNPMAENQPTFDKQGQNVGRDQYNIAGDQIINQAPQPPLPERPRDERILLQKVRTFWIKGVLENSLAEVVRLDLHLESRPELVKFLWEKHLPAPNEPTPLPQDQPLIDVFHRLNESLLILGEPGSGKTTMLLELGRDLLTQAEADVRKPVPVVFNLSSWVEKEEPLAEWLVEELNRKYLVPKKISTTLVEGHRLLLLLDGLDEVAETKREACVAAINAFNQESLMPLVVCSRIADYQRLTTQLNLEGAILIQPLSEAQVQAYFEQAGESLAALRTAMQADEGLQEMVTSPLLLSIASFAYRGVSQEALSGLGGSVAQRKHLFDTYIEKVLHRRGQDERYTEKQIKAWLAWLAGRMIEHKQSVFQIEGLQPNWLSRRIAYRLFLGLTFGPLIGLFVGAASSLILGLGSGLIAGVLLGVLGGLYFALGKLDIKPVDSVKWSVKKGLTGGLIVGLISSLVFGLITGLVDGLIDGVIYGPFAGLIFGLAFGLFGGLDLTQLERRLTPNEGIRQSGKNGLIFGLTVGLIFGLCFGLFGGLLIGPFGGLIIGLFGALTMGLFVGLLSGGHAVLRHYILRLILARTNCLPWKLPQFLDYAADRILLRKVGGGYIFIHRMVMEHFAAMEGEE